MVHPSGVIRAIEGCASANGFGVDIRGYALQLIPELFDGLVSLRCGYAIEVVCAVGLVRAIKWHRARLLRGENVACGCFSLVSKAG